MVPYSTIWPSHRGLAQQCSSISQLWRSLATTELVRTSSINRIEEPAGTLGMLGVDG